MATKIRPGGRQRLFAGPFSGTLATSDPYDAVADKLVDAKNAYVLDPAAHSGYAARPGFRRLFNGAPLIDSPAGTFRGQLVYTHANLDASTVNFIVMGGKVLRIDQSLSIATDVTPVDVMIDAERTTRVFAASSVGELMFTDGVNRPWIATNLDATPITGTYIDYDGNDGDWQIQGKPVVYENSLFAALKRVNSVARDQDISWAEPGHFADGWEQADFDNNWTLAQNQSGKLYCLQADNVALRYSRENSWGAITGTPGPNLASTATNDAVAFNIGSQCPQSIVTFGNGFFFLDAQGRPYWQQPGAAPDPIWKQMRSFVDEGTTNYPTTTAIVATAVLDPTLNLYHVAIWSPNPNIQASPVEWHTFDAQTRIYQGRGSIGGEGTVTSIDCMGVLTDSAGRSTVIVLAADGYVWAQNALGATPENIATEGGVFLCTEDLNDLVTEGQAQQWTDDGEVPDISFKTDRLGFDEDIEWLVDQGVVVTLNGMPVRVVIGTSAQSDTLEGVPQPGSSKDGTYRLPFGASVFGRGPSVTIKPLSADEQFVLERINLTAIASIAGPEDL